MTSEVRSSHNSTHDDGSEPFGQTPAQPSGQTGQQNFAQTPAQQLVQPSGQTGNPAHPLGQAGHVPTGQPQTQPQPQHPSNVVAAASEGRGQGPSSGGVGSEPPSMAHKFASVFPGTKANREKKAKK